MQFVLDNSSPRVSSIPKGEDEEVPCSFGSVGFNDFGFLAGEAIPDVSSDEDDIGKVFRSSGYREYTTTYPYLIIPKPYREKGESPFKAGEIESSVFKANLFTYWGMFRVSADVHFWVPGPK